LPQYWLAPDLPAQAPAKLPPVNSKQPQAAGLQQARKLQAQVIMSAEPARRVRVPLKLHPGQWE
jgi:hypothetical protein